jgi:hypothetical protein
MKRLNPEIALGFLIATVLWIGVLGWQASYAPTDSEKRQCEESATKTGHKTEECKTLWERTTTDPVAFFTFWLVVFTGGLGVSTVMLWRAGERQIELARETSTAQSRDMQASIRAAQDAARSAAESAYSERAWVSHHGFEKGSAIDPVIDGIHYPEGIVAIPIWKNTGRSPAIRASVYTASAVTPPDAPVPMFVWDEESQRAGVLGQNLLVVGNARLIAGDELAQLQNRELSWYIYSKATYRTIFEPNIVRVSESCHIVELNGHERLPDGTVAPRILFSPIGPQNTAS